jgi:phosphoglycolate phosphatase
MTALIAFDVDGVLFSAEPFVADAYREALTAVETERPGTFTRVPSAREILDQVGWPVHVIQQRLFPGLEEEAGRLLYDATANAMAAHAARGDGVLYLGVPETLRALRVKGYQLAIASNARPMYLRALFERYPLEYLFVPPVTADEAGSKEAVLRTYLTRYGLSPQQVIMVGDRAADAEAARAVGCWFVGCDYGHGYRHEIEQAGPVASRFSDLPDLIEGILDRHGRPEVG